MAWVAAVCAFQVIVLVAKACAISLHADVEDLTNAEFPLLLFVDQHIHCVNQRRSEHRVSRRNLVLVLDAGNVHVLPPLERRIAKVTHSPTVKGVRDQKNSRPLFEAADEHFGNLSVHKGVVAAISVYEAQRLVEPINEFSAVAGLCFPWHLRHMTREIEEKHISLVEFFARRPQLEENVLFLWEAAVQNWVCICPSNLIREDVHFCACSLCQVCKTLCILGASDLSQALLIAPVVEADDKAVRAAPALVQCATMARGCQHILILPCLVSTFATGHNIGGATISHGLPGN